MICIGRYAGRQEYALQHGGQNYFCLYLVECLIVTLRCAEKSYHIIFSTISLKFTCKISVQKELIDSFKIIFWSRDQLRTSHLKKMVRV